VKVEVKKMKEAYFTPSTLQQKSQEMLAEVYELRLKHDLYFQTEHSALLVLDMQDYFLRQSSHAYIPSAEAVIPNILKYLVR
jgi:isochorismate hydrolase